VTTAVETVVEMAPTEVQPAAENRRSRPVKEKPRNNDRRDDKGGPIVGMGDHVPDFLTRGT
jgi:hypothetical protein